MTAEPTTGDIRLGTPFPLGATPLQEGVNFAVFAGSADAVDLCLFDEVGHERRIRLPGLTHGIHHGQIGGIAAGQAYGFRAHGRWEPAAGMRANPAKLLIDPYARAIAGDVRWDATVFGHRQSDPRTRSLRDDAAAVPRSIVVGDRFDWGDDAPPSTPLEDSVVYEAHVKGMTMRHPDVPAELRGSYAGLACPPILDHLRQLGVTAIELLPVHQFITEHHLAERRLTNYWGYNSIGFFAPHGAYSSSGDRGEQVGEFKAMVKAFHEAGIEVLLDVVYNHTAEGNDLGGTFSFKGLDNAAYYVLADDRSRYVDHTGTGNSLDLGHPETLRLVMDSLRYWVDEMHVDGFRFDLATALARGSAGFDTSSAFFSVIGQDPTVGRVKLIAEPWDVGPGGYQVGRFPYGWSEWNDRYRDGVRDYWRGWDETLADFAYRFTGSSDLYEASGRLPSASVNFVTSHDGFTLADLVAYNDKHNNGNGEDGRDGTTNNRSWNSGAEGPTDDPSVQSIRQTRIRSLLATLLLSQGVPMVVAGDEMGRSQGGNNNAYAQDNEVSWLDWDGADEELLAFTRRVISIRADHPVFRRHRWFADRGFDADGQHEIDWFTPDGTHMTDEDWRVGYAKSLTVHLNGSMLGDHRGDGQDDDSFLVLFNSGGHPCDFTVPAELEALYPGSNRWTVELVTSIDGDEGEAYGAGDSVAVAPWSLAVLRRPRGTAR